MRRIVLFLAVTHAGHQLALCNPDTLWRDEGERGQLIWVGPTLTKLQTWLWGQYQEHMGQVLEYAKGDSIVLVHNGDITWGTKYPEMLVSSRKDVQPTIGYYNLLPWLETENVKDVCLIHGTSSHEFGEGSSNIVLANMFSQAFQEKKILTSLHLLATVDGVSFDIAHHGPSGGIRNWTTGNQYRHNLRSMMQDDINCGRTPPRLAARAHYHTYVHETVRIPVDKGEIVSDIIMVPGYCGLTHYAVQATRSAYRIQVGMVACEVVDEHLTQIIPFCETVDIRTEVTL